MDQNQTANDDLQKAIDDITNTTSVDPVFSDPVAAPSSVPEGDTGELGEPVGPFPQPKVEMITPGPEPIAPIEPMNIPELSDLGVPLQPAPTPEGAMPDFIPTPIPGVAPLEAEVPAETPAPFAEAPLPDVPALDVPIPEPISPEELVSQLPTPEPTPEPAPISEPTPEPEPTPEEPTPEEPLPETIEETKEEIEESPQSSLTIKQIKKSALRDLVPLIGNLGDIDAAQKINLYKDIFEELNDYSVLELAYNATKEIDDDTKRAEALRYIIEAIDKM